MVIKSTGKDLNMPTNIHTALFNAEEIHKEKVYCTFDKMCKEANKKVREYQNIVNRGAYDDQEAFMVFGGFGDAKISWHQKESLVQKLYPKPYFAHIEAEDPDGIGSEHYYLSDCETLNEMIMIGNNGYLFPFKQDRKRPVSSALFHIYQSKKGEPVSYSIKGREFFLYPKLICDDEIDTRELIDAIQLYPESGILQLTADELLEEKLQENRNNPTLRNIIATLQRMQFQIIEADVKQSFVVQGCAGSGKTQCLLHRLFYLRDTLSEEGWEHVLLLTPTQLFRNYSADLIKRYQLSSVENCSVASLYHKLLNVYDPRFKERHYYFELSEEYLPDGYLREIYNVSFIDRIKAEIQRAIKGYVEAGCKALDINLPETITYAQISDIVKQLDLEMESFDAREAILQQDQEYSDKRKRFEAIQQNRQSLQKRKEKLQNDYQKINESIDNLNSKIAALQEAENERAEWLEQRKADHSHALEQLSELAERWNQEDDIQLPLKYANQLFLVQDMLSGDAEQSVREYTEFLNEYCEQAKKDLKKLVNNQLPERVLIRYENRKKDILLKEEQLSAQIEELDKQAEVYAEWLRNRSELSTGEKNRRALHRKEMESARFFLARIESAVFEREVWRTLTPLKEKYRVNSLNIEKLSDGHQKEERILYKSDLLFYLAIYSSLYPDKELPDYRLICIDEGQDLHKADYDILHKLYPKAVFNVFGDTAQVLHTSCGIHNWKKESGIENIYLLNTNYRNTAAIVDFCNQMFSASMDYVGKVKNSQKPHRIKEPSQMKSAVENRGISLIVKDRKSLAELCGKIGKPISDFEFLDTKSEKLVGDKIPCYSIFAAKGLEFTNVAVYASGMTENQKVVACTRAMEELYYYA